MTFKKISAILDTYAYLNYLKSPRYTDMNPTTFRKKLPPSWICDLEFSKYPNLKSGTQKPLDADF